MKAPLRIGLVATILSLSLVPLANAGQASDIFQAARFGDTARLAQLIEKDPTLVAARSATNETPLHSAVGGKQVDAVLLLLAHGADVNVSDNAGLTPLHIAARASDSTLTLTLLAAGAAVDARDRDGDTPLHDATRHVRSDNVRALLSAGADVTAENANGQTPLHVLGVDLRVQDELSVQRAQTLADVLVAAGADPAIIADGLPAFRPAQPPLDNESRYAWVDYDDIGPDLLAYETNYPALCRRIDAGLSYEGRHLWVLKISDNVDVEEDEPEFKYIATMHGDEVVGTTMCMYLIDYLLTNYGTDAQCTNIIDEVELYIMPLMNPDGYDRTSRTRYNSQGYDLNRNFPEGAYGEANDPTGRPTEVQVLMNWSAQYSFVASANFHGGSLVVNYPFDNDNLGSVFSPSPDEDMFVYISEEYSQYNSPMWNGDWTHGITNGAEWYSIDGGMQDWNYRYMGNNEVTIELSNIKEPSASTIPTFWDENRDSMLAYIETCLIGVRGIVYDAGTGQPLDATVRVVGRDHDVYTDPDVGDYHRMLIDGTYDLEFEARGTGYDPVIVEDVVVVTGECTRVDVPIGPAALMTYPNGGETLTAGTPVTVTWMGGATEFQVQQTANYGVGGFEDGSLPAEFITGGDVDWFVDDTTGYTGTHSARAGDIGNNDVTWMTRTTTGGDLSFWYKVSSEEDYDWFNFSVDGDQVIHASGEVEWILFETTLDAGSHELEWEYVKDFSVSNGSDTVWIDEVALPDDYTVWTDIVTMTDPGQTTASWTPTQASTACKIRVRAYYGGGDYGDWDESDDIFAVEPGSNFPAGDSNCDTAVNFDDIDFFVAAIIDQAQWEGMFGATPTCDYIAVNDLNDDAAVNFDDIDPFVEALVGS